MCVNMNNLFKSYVKRNGRDANLRPIGCKSDALTITPPRHTYSTKKWTSLPLVPTSASKLQGFAPGTGTVYYKSKVAPYVIHRPSVVASSSLSCVYTSATCCAATSCADEQHVASNKQHVAGNKLLVRATILLTVTSNMLRATSDMLLVARNMLLVVSICRAQHLNLAAANEWIWQNRWKLNSGDDTYCFVCFFLPYGIIKNVLYVGIGSKLYDGEFYRRFRIIHSIFDRMSALWRSCIIKVRWHYSSLWCPQHSCWAVNWRRMRICISAKIEFCVFLWKITKYEEKTAYETYKNCQSAFSIVLFI